MDDVDALIKPDNLIKYLNEHVGALQNFDPINPSSKRLSCGI
jgi:hypothetical protein